MQTNDGSLPPLSARVSRLFATFHARSAPEQSVDDVARSVSAMLGRIVPGAEIAALRAGEYDRDFADPQILAALAKHFGVPPAYLAGADATAVRQVEKELLMLAATRDAGVRSLNLRGKKIDIGELADHLKRLAKRRSDSPDEAATRDVSDTSDLGE
ncbi:hypothetical protein SAMN05421776_11318 [Nocardia farcinica]|uniref:Uncharacterized protein n=1 Tax=Nocardia farcinica TaxID=37329 RepID=A0A0H5PB21_NOCFR|nr:hypothetical protein [Nocardia farcinica]PFW99364.1 hypothetical protein CJ469_05284 [Nocardia farcinica]PFX06775.1 hypothetical protein CJ468_04175 [Nocardia farcinica]CRY84608.1 Uncharacterised protein [Nocardia farcinica]SIT32475.1 hypothetical protein SAMN05421776_11318 [Nocardia farcinica]